MGTQRLQRMNLHPRADVSPAEVRKFCDLDDAGRESIKAAMRQLGHVCRHTDVGTPHGLRGVEGCARAS